MVTTQLLVVGGGPGGLAAANAAASLGIEVLLVDEGLQLGGQLVKQTHKFFGSREHHAGVRGIDIPDLLMQHQGKITVLSNTAVIGCYEDKVLTAVTGEDKYFKIRPEAVVFATGASEKFLAFPGNDLPGVYGAGAVQTLMNQYGVLPGKSVLMVGAGNIGIIVSYQLLQAGIPVRAVVEAAPNIGAYLVHASKIARAGVPILTRHTIVEASGTNAVESAVIARLDDDWQVIPGSEREIEVDVVCLAVGLSPVLDLLRQVGCKTKYVPELGGEVPLRDSQLKTSIDWIFVAGDAAGVEEASAAMVEGRLAGAAAAAQLGADKGEAANVCAQCQASLDALRRGPVGAKIRAGIAKLEGDAANA
ncbi:MAG: NAD(P)/FAD-dependent oxidoreductase [Bacillota bacterium]|jgi:sarcosine oxidase subunit alpha|nr:FAD-dependent oxidoreductase [Bacillota bacterium]HOC06081.1 FAD-dependent oxidoreductase [Bacillota bacterium]HPZ21612.1 FAD-dependent oxidoreductase [Bacillota bacterium]HQD19448.1 FAD-dependent oxidoreductase [Bacillota bacterium]